MIRNITQRSPLAIPTDIKYLLTRHPYQSSIMAAGGEVLNVHTVGSADWVVVEGADNEPTIQAYTAKFQERILPLMPEVNQNGTSKRAEPREGQIRSLYYLCEDRRDVILVARTGFGKSVIFQLAPLLRPGICLIISPR